MELEVRCKPRLAMKLRPTRYSIGEELCFSLFVEPRNQAVRRPSKFLMFSLLSGIRSAYVLCQVDNPRFFCDC